MPVTIKSAYIKYKDSLGQYVGIDSVAETSTAEQVAAIEAKGEEVLESIPADYSELSEAVTNPDTNTLFAADAEEGQIIVADGNGSWAWEDPNFIRAVDPSSGTTINIPEIKDSTVSETDTWSSDKISDELADKQDETITDTEGDFTATTVEGALHELHDAIEDKQDETITDAEDDFTATTVEGALHELHDEIEAKTYTAGQGIAISSGNVISLKGRTMVHRTVTLTEDQKYITVDVGAKMQSFTLFLSIPVDENHAQTGDVRMYIRITDANGDQITNTANKSMMLWSASIYKAANANPMVSRHTWSVDEFGLVTFTSCNASTDTQAYNNWYSPSIPFIFDPDLPHGIKLQCHLLSSEIVFPSGTVADFYVILQEGETV